MGKVRQVAVIGSGISGIAAALRLHDAGAEVDILEAGPRLGGRFGVARLGDRPVMLGGKNIGRRYSALRALLARTGPVRYEEFGINSSRPVGGRLLRIDSTSRLRTLRTLLRMGGPRDLARLGAMAWALRRDEQARFLGSALSRRLATRYGDPTLTRHFGPEITTNLLRPITVRMNGAEPDEIHLSTFGTNLGMVLDTYDQLADGIEPLLDTAAATVPVHTRTRVCGLAPARGGGLRVRVRAEGETGESELRYDAAVLAVPANAAAPVLADVAPALSTRLAGIRYFPSTVAVVEYADPLFPADLRAVAMDDGPCSNAGAYGATDRHLVRYTFSGKQGRLENPSDAEVLNLVRDAEQRLAGYLGHAVPRRVRAVVRHWESAYCAYASGYPDLLDTLHEQVAAVPGLALAGDYLLGVSLESCCRSGQAAAERVLAS